MALHQTSGRGRLGLTLAALTAGLWATLPVALKYALEQLDPLTLTWFRFLVAFVLFGAFVAARGQLGRFAALGRRGWWLMAVAAAMLTGNYVCYLFGLHHTTPANSQLLIQLAPLLMAVGGIVVFRERFTRRQWMGSAVLLVGLGLFFRDQLGLTIGATDAYLGGSGFIALAAIAWAAYALCQKQLLGTVSSAHVLTFIFGVASVVLLPFADLGAFAAIDGWHWLAIGYCALNTLAAYGAFAEALAHVEASRVSAVLAINPLLTLGVVAVAHAAAPAAFDAAGVATLGLLGAVLAVVGSMLTSLGRRAKAVPQPPALVAPEPEPSPTEA